ncbi:MAG: anthranilate phosphoribosyltransferase [Planctomycetota bacterium]
MSELTYTEMLQTVRVGQSLTREQAADAFGQIMAGRWSEAQIAAMLTALAAKGESVDEIVGAALAMRKHAVGVDTRGADVIDTCGTGGTGLRTFNISTAAGLVAAGAGAKVAKHGNRTHTRASGSADVLSALGVNLDAPTNVVADCLERANFCFCFAVRCHPAMKHAAPVRKALGVRTIFNLLGPLTNPASARRQVMGVYESGLTATVAEVLGALGAVHAMVVHAEDGLDELSTTAETTISHWQHGRVIVETARPEDFALPRARLADLLVNSAAESAEVIRGVLAGVRGPARDIVLLNAAAALTVADLAPTIVAALPMAAESVDSGAARQALATLVKVSHTL